MTHPPAFRLDALAAGDEDATTAAHVATCEPCAGYVKALEGDVAAFRSTADPDAFAKAVAERTKPSRKTNVARLAWYAAPTFAAAAAFLLWVGRSSDVPRGRTSEVATVDESRVHFKGGVSVAVVRERGGAQERLSGPFEVAPSDRIRVEVSLDRDAPVTAGLLSADGTWTPLLAPAALRAGTHFSELAARFDETPTDAVLLVGPPDEVTRARASRLFDGVVAWRVRSKPRE